jgi:predicted Zn finger-like uncharacterized protein
MVLTCPQCETRLQLDEAKTPSRPFAVRCPKCQTNVNVQPNGEAVTAPKPDHAHGCYRSHATQPGFSFRAAGDGTEIRASRPGKDCELKSRKSSALNDIAKLLAEALSHSNGHSGTARKRPAWDRRKVLVCASPAYREAIAESLITQDYDVFVAENMVQGLGRMREERMDVIVLDASFDPLEQGVAFITREVRLLRPSERRRLFFVYVTSGVRTMDLHAAFLHNVNLVVNPSDVEQLPEALGVSIRHYNDLYRPFNRALDIAPI